MPPAARLTDMHVCPMVTVIVPHVGGPIVGPGVPTVLIGFMPAAVVGDNLVCVGPPDVIAMGSPTVLVGNKPAARLGDETAHGGVIVLGCPTVMMDGAGGGGGGGGGGGLKGFLSGLADTAEGVAEEAWDQYWGFEQGVGDGIIGIGKGIFNVVWHPVNTVNALRHTTLKQIGTAIIEPYKEAIATGEYGRAVGRGVVEVGSLFLGGAGAGAAAGSAASKFGELASATGKLAEGLDAANVASKTVEVVDAANVASDAANASKLAESVDAANAGTKVTDTANAADKTSEVTELTDQVETSAAKADSVEKLQSLAEDSDGAEKTANLSAPSKASTEVAVTAPEAVETTAPALKFGENDLVYGVNTNNRLRALQESSGGKLLTDLDKPPELDWYQFTEQTLQSAAKSGQKVNFDLSGMTDIPDVLANQGKWAGKVTSAELRYVRDNWNSFTVKPSFFKNGVEVPPPF